METWTNKACMLHAINVLSANTVRILGGVKPRLFRNYSKCFSELTVYRTLISVHHQVSGLQSFPTYSLECIKVREISAVITETFH